MELEKIKQQLDRHIITWSEHNINVTSSQTYAQLVLARCEVEKLMREKREKDSSYIKKGGLR